MTLLADACRVSRRAAWAGVGAPKNTPAEIIDTLNREISVALVDPTIKARFADLSGEVLALSPSEYGKRIAEETEISAADVRSRRRILGGVYQRVAQ